MTAYHGGKQKIGKQIAKLIHDESIDIEEEYDFVIKGYCEPFCGMLGVYQHIPELFEDHSPKLNYKAGDMNASVIQMWKLSQKGWKPPTEKYTKTEFMSMAGDGKSSAEKGYVGHLYGYMGKYFKPFDNRTTVSRRNKTSSKVSNIGLELSKVNFINGSYDKFSHLKNFIIYCDPPYEIQNYYYDENDTKRKFEHKKFWDWCRKMSTDNIVYISEYSAPKDFEQIWSKNKEKLFLNY
jgi:DNA adenine methylase